MENRRVLRKVSYLYALSFISRKYITQNNQILGEWQTDELYLNYTGKKKYPLKSTEKKMSILAKCKTVKFTENICNLLLKTVFLPI